MALRIRKNRKKIACAAVSKPRKDDCYLNDDVHYVLAQEMKILHTNNEGETWFFETKKEE